MKNDDETTAAQVRDKLQLQNILLSTIYRARQELGWTYKRAAYCQLIRHINVKKRFDWAVEHVNDDFHDVIFTDETSVMLESHRRLCYRKKGDRPKPKPRAKHPTKVHVWAGISWNGATKICIFSGIMNAEMYIQILQRSLLPSISKLYPTHHRLMQDNNLKHTSKAVQTFFIKNQINW